MHTSGDITNQTATMRRLLFCAESTKYKTQWQHNAFHLTFYECPPDHIINCSLAAQQAQYPEGPPKVVDDATLSNVSAKARRYNNSGSWLFIYDTGKKNCF
jgi:hypothetical protein